jgi:pullulanase
LAVSADLLNRKTTHFVLWHPSSGAPNPTLVIGHFQAGNPPTLADERRHPLTQVAGLPDLFEIAAADCGLVDGDVYHYWFEVQDSDPAHPSAQLVRCTDPTAYTVDWRLRAPRLPTPDSANDRQPAAVIKFRGGRLVPSDPGGEEIDLAGDPSPGALAPNNRLVIYELPTAWSRLSEPDDLDIGTGTFLDTLALIDPAAPAANFANLAVAAPGRSYLTELGINALELLPPSDSFFKRVWGYDTAHYLAPDAGLGFPDEFSSSTANRDLGALVRGCHRSGIRFFVDAVMAFARHEAYQTINLEDFYITDPAADPSDPDSHTSRHDGSLRYGFGSTLFRYARFQDCYDPVSGIQANVVPARQLMLTYLTRWMRDFRVDGIRMDSIENIASWDFVQAFKDRAHALFADRWAAEGLGAGSEERFLVVGEELWQPLDLLSQRRLDGLWNDRFRSLVRAAIVGESEGGSFESTVRNAIDCRNLGFTDGAQAVNYVTSHDVEGYRRERLFNFLLSRGLDDNDIERRVKLAFVCLLTAVGIPMILAGEEFADEHDRFDRLGQVTQAGGKQVDPVNYTRLQDNAITGSGQPDPRPPLRRRILAYIGRLVALRTTHPSLAVNDTEFIHVDFDAGKRVLAWRRGLPDADPVVVVANFSDYTTPDAENPTAEYVVRNWPVTPPGRQWREVTQQRSVPAEWIGREPVFRWEAKVYTLA